MPLFKLLNGKAFNQEQVRKPARQIQLINILGAKGVNIYLNYYYRYMFKRLLVVVLLCCAVNSLCAQTVLKGFVKNSNGRPIMDATVAIEGTSFVSITEKDGSFELNYTSQPNLVMRVHSMNYQDKRVHLDKVSKPLKMEVVLSDSPFNLSEVVVTGTGNHTRLKNVPIQTQLFNSKEIKDLGAISVEQALSNLNSSVNYSEHLGLFLNGLGKRNVLILIDGNRIYGDTSGQTDLNRIDMSKVKRIEVIRGAASALYGSEAMGGVINIITQNPQDQFDFNSNTRISKHGQFYQAVDLSAKADWFTTQISYERKQTDGWQLNSKEFNKSDSTFTETGKQAMTGYYQDILRQKYTFKPIEGLTLNAFGTIYQRKTKRKYDYYTYDMAYNDFNVGVSASYRLNKLGYLSLKSYFDNYEYYKDYFKEDTKAKRTVGDKQLSKRQRFSNTTLRGVFNLGSYHKLSSGIDYTTEQLKSPGKLDKTESAYTAAIFAQDEMKFFNEHFLVTAGFRALHHKEFNNHFIPSLSLMYSSDHFNARATYSTGFRAPDMMEMYYESENMNGTTINHPNRNLKPEKSQSYSANVEYFNSFIMISANAYVNFIDNIIQRTVVNDEFKDDPTANPKATHYRYMNVAEARTRGFDTSLKFQICQGLTLGFGYSFLDAVDMKTKQKLEATSKHSGTMNLNYSKDWAKYYLNVNFNGRIQDKTYYAPIVVKKKPFENNARSYNLWNINTTHRIKVCKGFTPTLTLGVDNIFNFKDDNYFGLRYSTYSPGRSVVAGIIINFNK